MLTQVDAFRGQPIFTHRFQYLLMASRVRLGDLRVDVACESLLLSLYAFNHTGRVGPNSDPHAQVPQTWRNRHLTRARNDACIQVTAR